jgi:hypothetical protein
MTVTWWDYTNYPLRRNILVTPPIGDTILAGHPLYYSLPYTPFLALNKIRPDFEDIEVGYWNGSTWQVVARDIEYGAEFDEIIISFNAVTDISTTNSGYYIYMSNLNLLAPPTRPVYTSAQYAIEVTPTEGVGLMLSRPTEDWNGGESITADARAALSFTGKDARLVMEKGPDRGILELQIDGGWEQIDTYASTTQEAIVYTTSDLDIDKHYIRIRATGSKNPSSTGTTIKIVKFEYSRYIAATTIAEELNTELTPILTIVGP